MMCVDESEFQFLLLILIDENTFMRPGVHSGT